jgi:hypothetical protein
MPITAPIVIDSQKRLRMVRQVVMSARSCPYPRPEARKVPLFGRLRNTRLPCTFKATLGFSAFAYQSSKATRSEYTKLELL